MEFFKKGDILTADSLNELAEVLTNAGGCVVPRVAGAVARQAYGQPGPAWFNDATAVGATGRSYFDDATESMVYGPGDCEGLIAGAHWNREIRELKISDGVLHLPMAHEEEHHEIDPEDDTVEHFAGGVDSIAVRGNGGATIRNGTIYLPLARSPEKEIDDKTGEEYETAEGWAGMLSAAEFTTGIAAPVLKRGILQLPLAHCPTFVGEWDGVTDITPKAGGIRGISYGSGISAPTISNGEILLPQPTGGGGIEPGGGSIEPASFVGTVTTSVDPGGLKGAEFVSRIEHPQASHGILQLPLAHCPTYFGEWDGVTDITPKAGAIRGISYGSSISSPTISDGEILLPQPTAGEPIKGAKGLLTGDRTWAQISEGTGGELDVAGCWVNGAYLKLSLGLNNGFLTFTLSA